MIICEQVRLRSSIASPFDCVGIDLFIVAPQALCARDSIDRRFCVVVHVFCRPL